GGRELGILEKRGSWFSYNGEKIGQGKENARKTIEGNPALMAEIEQKIKTQGDALDLTSEAYSLDEDDEDDPLGNGLNLNILDVSADD
ncbi:MAG: hypothetical protein KBS76_06585, partial [Ruminococcus sp.]|nr:hypothetical protein [Candidatus Apopatosoma intestinale]